MSGCSDDNVSQDSQEFTVPHITGTVTEAVVTEPPSEKLFEASDDNYIYDNARILSQEELTECNNYAGWINSRLMLNTAVVTTDKLGNLTPEKYAEKCYSDIFKNMGSGIILLINNDTNKDYIYKHGTSSLYITEQTESEAFYYATKSIVKGDYKSGILELLSLAEDCPKHIFDNGAVFDSEQIRSIESILATNSNVNTFIATTNNITDKTNTELSSDFYNRFYLNDENKGSMLFIDISLDEAVITDGSVPETSIKKINELVKAKNYYGAVNEFLSSLGIASADNT